MKTAAKTKPFPWKCQDCFKKAVYPAVVDYPIAIEYDGRTYNIIVKGLKAPQCKECHGIFPDSEANHHITLEFRRQAGLLSHHQIRNNRERLNLTQKQPGKYAWLRRSHCLALGDRCANTATIPRQPFADLFRFPRRAKGASYRGMPATAGFCDRRSVTAVVD